MKTNDQAPQTKKIWSFTTEIHQAFIDWVKELPFLPRDIPKDPERVDTEEEFADQGSASHATRGTLAVQSRDDKGRHR